MIKDRDGISKGGHWDRRRFMAKLGAGGLATATALFAQAETASASCGATCCNLYHCPPNTSMASCESVTHYTWICQLNPHASCRCCEKGASWTASAYSCSYT